MADVTRISPDTRVAGRIEGTQDVVVEGQVEGTVVLGALLHVAPSGFVSGEVQAREVHIEGAFVGELRAESRVVLLSTARVKGNIVTPLLEMADGAQLAGELAIGEVDAGLGHDAPASRPVSRSTSTPVARTTTVAARPAATTPLPTARPAPAASSPVRSVAERAQDSRTPTSTASSAQTVTTVTTVVEEVEEVEATTEAAVADAALDSTQETTPAPASEQDKAPSLEEAIHELHDDYSVKELREELRRRDLAVSGTKAELLERLLQAEAAEQKG